MRARGWAWPSAARSSSGMAAPSRRGAPPDRAAPSSSSCRSGKQKENPMPKSDEPVQILMADDDLDDRMMAEKALHLYRLKNGLRFVEDGQELMDYLRHQGQYADAA